MFIFTAPDYLFLTVIHNLLHVYSLWTASCTARHRRACSPHFHAHV